MVEAFQDDFTLAEQKDGIENVVTGLKRKLWEEDSDEEGDNDKMEDIKPVDANAAELDGIQPSQEPSAIERILRVMSSGRMAR